VEPVKTPKQRQREKEADRQQEHEHMKGHTKPRCLKWERGELLEKQGEGETPMLSSEWVRCSIYPPP
jgi:hypothetical protein